MKNNVITEEITPPAHKEHFMALLMQSGNFVRNPRRHFGEFNRDHHGPRSQYCGATLLG
jgi:hypothetical protein